ncbi:MAG: hypothetical protein AB1420_04870 [Bacillota bacterium]
MAKPRIGTLKVAAAYIGTIVGAGFASGQEILQFFGFFGGYGLFGLILSGIFFSLFGYMLLDLGRRLKADSHLPVIKFAGGKYIGTAIDYVITFFLFGALTVMAAGAGALFSEQFGLPSLLGSGMLMLITLVTVLLGITGVINAIAFVTPVLLAAVFLVAVLSFTSAGFDLSNLAAARLGNPTVPFWSIAAFLYVSYNLVVAVAVLAPLGNEAGNQRILRAGAVWGGIGLALGAGAIYLSVIVHMPRAGEFAIPMIYVVSQISPLVQLFYALVLFAEVYTTAVGSLYGFSARLISPKHPNSWKYITGTTVAALAASLVGFTNLVRYLFPAVGIMGILMIGAVSWVYVKELFVGLALIRGVPEAARKRVGPEQEVEKEVPKEEKSSNE